MTQFTTTPAVPNTRETVRLDPRLDILLWVEDAPYQRYEPDVHVVEDAGDELSEVDFLDAALADYRSSCPPPAEDESFEDWADRLGLHEDPSDSRYMDDVPGYWESRQPWRF